jgi:hypothetical protein
MFIEFAYAFGLRSRELLFARRVARPGDKVRVVVLWISGFFNLGVVAKNGQRGI